VNKWREHTLLWVIQTFYQEHHSNCTTNQLLSCLCFWFFQWALSLCSHSQVACCKSRKIWWKTFGDPFTTTHGAFSLWHPTTNVFSFALQHLHLCASNVSFHSPSLKMEIPMCGFHTTDLRLHCLSAIWISWQHSANFMLTAPVGVTTCLFSDTSCWQVNKCFTHSHFCFCLCLLRHNAMTISKLVLLASCLWMMSWKTGARVQVLSWAHKQAAIATKGTCVQNAKKKMLKLQQSLCYNHFGIGAQKVTTLTISMFAMTRCGPRLDKTANGPMDSSDAPKLRQMKVHPRTWLTILAFC